MLSVENDAQSTIYALSGNGWIDGQARESGVLQCNMSAGAKERFYTGCFASAFSDSDFADIELWNGDTGVLLATIPDVECVYYADAD